MIKAIGNKICLVPVEKEEATSGLSVVEVKKDTLLLGKVESIGELVPVDIDVDLDDFVYFSVYGGEECEGRYLVTEDLLYAKQNREVERASSAQAGGAREIEG